MAADSAQQALKSRHFRSPLPALEPPANPADPGRVIALLGTKGCKLRDGQCSCRRPVGGFAGERQRLAKCPCKLVESKRLVEYVPDAAALRFEIEFGDPIAGDQNHRQVRPQLEYRFGKGGATQAGHALVGDHRVVAARILAQRVQCALRIGKSHGLVAQRCGQLLDQCHQLRFIIDDQNRLAAAGPTDRRTISALGASASTRSRRQ